MSKAKLYELRRMLNAKFETVYMGVHVTLNFRAGFGINGHKVGQLMTSNQFVQDAIEHDGRFGSMFVLKREYNDDEPESEDRYQLRQIAAAPAVRRPQKTNAEIFAENQAKRAAKKAKSETVKPTVKDIPEVKNLNDAVGWFADKGELLKDAGEIESLCKKHGVNFPNLTI